MASKLKEAEAKLRRYMISASLVQNDYNVRRTAKDLGITPEGLHWNLKKLHLTMPQIRQLASEMNLPTRVGAST
jgi:transcriptional regulator with GAF, ATPase, and Fis domain